MNRFQNFEPRFQLSRVAEASSHGRSRRRLFEDEHQKKPAEEVPPPRQKDEEQVPAGDPSGALEPWRG